MSEPVKMCEWCHKRPARPFAWCPKCKKNVLRNIKRWFDDHPGADPAECVPALLARHHARELDADIGKLLGH